MITQILATVLAIGLGVWGLKYVISLYIFSRRKEKINKLRARIAILKLHLRTKVKRKCNRVEKALRSDREELEKCSPHLSSLQQLQFEATTDYQKIFDLLLAVTEVVSQHIRLKHRHIIKDEKMADFKDANKEQILSPEEEVKEKCRKLVKYDKATVTIILDLVQTTADLISSISDYNELTNYENNQQKITDIPTRIEIQHFDELYTLLEELKTNPQAIPQDVQVLERSLFDEDEAA